MIHIKTKIITPLLAIVLFAFTTGCSRPAKNYSNSIIQQFTSLSEALAAFSSSTNYYITFSETASAVAATNRVLYENLRYVRENCLLDIKKMTPEEFAKYSNDADAQFTPVKKRILEQMKKIKSTIKADKVAPESFGVPVYSISGDRFYFNDVWNNSYDIELLVTTFNLKDHLTNIYKQ